MLRRIPIKSINDKFYDLKILEIYVSNSLNVCTVKNCYRELGMLFLFLFMGVLIFSSLVYVFENDDPDSTFITMLDAYWWALITMTTVGYGEVVPITGFGRLVGAICATFGVLVIALPIPIIGNQFGR